MPPKPIIHSAIARPRSWSASRLWNAVFSAVTIPKYVAPTRMTTGYAGTGDRSSANTVTMAA